MSTNKETLTTTVIGMKEVRLSRQQEAMVLPPQIIKWLRINPAQSIELRMVDQETLRITKIIDDESMVVIDAPNTKAKK